MADEYGLPHPEILFTVQGEGVKVYLTNTGIHYQLINVTYPEGYMAEPVRIRVRNHSALDEKIITRTTCLNVSLDGANEHPVVRKEGASNYYENFYLPTCPNGINNVPAYTRVVVEDVYPGIDWAIHSTGGKLKYDFIVHTGADPNKIRLRVNGAKDAFITSAGELRMITPLGEIREEKPVSYCGGREVTSRFSAKEENVFGFEIATYEQKKTLTIDPGIVWLPTPAVRIMNLQAPVVLTVVAMYLWWDLAPR